MPGTIQIVLSNNVFQLFAKILPFYFCLVKQMLDSISGINITSTLHEQTITFI